MASGIAEQGSISPCDSLHILHSNNSCLGGMKEREECAGECGGRALWGVARVQWRVEEEGGY